MSSLATSSSRGVLPFDQDELLLPQEVTLDTSFVLHSIVETERHHESAARFLERLADAGSTLVFNRLLELELREKATTIPLRERFPRDWRRRRHDRRSLSRARRLMTEAMRRWQRILDAADHLLVTVEEIHHLVPELMDHHGLSSYDAVHAATATYAGSGTIVTADAGFAAVPADELLLYTTASRVAFCRRMRAGR